MTTNAYEAARTLNPDLDSTTYEVARNLSPELDALAKVEAMEYFFSGSSTWSNAALAYDNLHSWDEDLEALFEDLPPIKEEYQCADREHVIELVNDEYWRLKTLMARALVLKGFQP